MVGFRQRGGFVLENSGGTTLPTFANATYYFPFVSSLKPAKAGPSVTFTRATTAWEINHEGFWKQVANNQARFHGTRIVENLLSQTSDISNAAWTKVATATASDADTLNLPAVNDALTQSASKTIEAAGGAAMRVDLKGTAGQTVTLRITASGTSTETSTKQVTLAAEYTTYALKHTCVSSNTTLKFEVFRNAADTATAVDVTNMQLEYFDPGDTNKNPSEYVSKDLAVITAPYHGLNVDGKKAFEVLNGSVLLEDGRLLSSPGNPIPYYWLRGLRTGAAVTNLNTYSDDITNAAWVKGGSLVGTIQATTNAYGKTNRSRIAGGSATSNKGVRNNAAFTKTANAVVLNSLIIEPNPTQRYVTLAIYDDIGSTNGGFICYDTVTHRITHSAVSGSGVIYDYKVDDCLNGRYRVSLWVSDSGGLTTCYARIGFSNVAQPATFAPSYLDAGEYVEFSGWMVVNNVTYLPAVVPTSGGTATVNAEAPSWTGLTGVNTGVIAATIQTDFMRSSGITYLLQVGTAWNNHNAIGYGSSSATTPGVFQMAGYTASGAFQDTGYYNFDGKNGPARVAMQYGTGLHRMSTNGYCVDYFGEIKTTSRSGPTSVSQMWVNGNMSYFMRDVAIWNSSFIRNDQYGVVAQSIPKVRAFIMPDGDSLTDHGDKTFSHDRQIFEQWGWPNDVVISNTALGSSKLQAVGGEGFPVSSAPSVTDRLAYVKAAFNASDARIKIYELHGGVNDYISGGYTAAQAYTKLNEILASVKTACPDVLRSAVCNTAYSTNSFGQDMTTSIVAGYAAGTLNAEDINRLGQNPHFDEAADTLDASYYSDPGSSRLHYSTANGKREAADECIRTWQRLGL